MKILWFGRSTLEKVLEKETRKKEKEEKQRNREEIESALKRIILFPGSKEEFEDFIKYETEWVDLGRIDKGLTYVVNHKDPFCLYSFEPKKRIVESGVVALINAQEYMNPSGRYHQFGMPVKKKEVQ